MLDWRSHIRERLSGAALEPMREREIVDEIAQHLEDRYADLVASGAQSLDAERSVLTELDASDILARRLRSVVRAVRPRPVVADAASAGLFRDLWNDVRYAVRTLLKNRG